jgi:hypothetical protein
MCIYVYMCVCVYMCVYVCICGYTALECPAPDTDLPGKKKFKTSMPCNVILLTKYYQYYSCTKHFFLYT